MSDTPDPSSITAALQAVRRRTLPPPNRNRDAIEMEQLFFRCLMVVLLVTQILGMWGGYRFLEGFAHPFPAPQPEVFVAVPDAK
jgi:hypothetical protein